MSWIQDHGWVVGLLVAAALALVGVAWWWTRRRAPATSVPGATARRRVDLAFAAAVLITLAIGWWAVVWLVEQADQITDEKAKAAAKADAVRTGAAIALGTGGAAYLLLAYRRQRLDEVDTRERRITELFTKAVEQLGHVKAPVRLGALYSLERLAQDNPEHRQTVVDVVCAYLRMPGLLSQTEPGPEQERHEALSVDDLSRELHPPPPPNPVREELQVRQAAQRILAAHLHLPRGIAGTAAQRRRPSPRQAFWPGISLDLSGAVLVALDFAGVSVRQARFSEATFQDETLFREAIFHVDAWFDGATFHGDAWFDRATFHSDAWFGQAAFEGYAHFDKAVFEGGARFAMARFQSLAGFSKVSFKRLAGFALASFWDYAWFNAAIFQGNVRFDDTTFSGSGGDKAIFDGARVQHLDDPVLSKDRVWPDRYTVQPDLADPTRGRLVHAEQAEEPEPAVPPSESTDQ